MLRLTRRYSGMQKIYDREKLESGEYRESPIVLRSKDGYSPQEKVTYTPDPENEGQKIRKVEMIPGKSFEVKDEEYVLQRHGAILEKV